jgi:hypothetical protein
VIGFGPLEIEAGKKVVFRADPMFDFSGSRLIVPSMIANNFAIDDLSVAETSQAVSKNPIPAAAFSELAVGVLLGLDEAKANKDPIELAITNTTEEKKTFSAALIGWTPKGIPLRHAPSVAQQTA